MKLWLFLKMRKEVVMPIRYALPKPSEKQKQFLKARRKHVGFGGSRGGGKSFAVRIKAIISCLKYKEFKVVIVRRTFPELIANHAKPLKKLLKSGTKDEIASYNKTEKEFTFKNGSTITLKYCKHEDDVDNFQGLECDFLFFDEATQLSEMQMKKITAIVRGDNGYPKRIFYTCNPGGPSHGYIKRIFIDKKYEEGEDADEYDFIQSSVYDNVALMKSNPDYIKQLEALPPKLRDAWLYGRWDVFEGAYFEEFRITPDPDMCHKAGISTEQALEEHRWTHVIEPFEPPPHWKIYRSYDWGYGKPFSCAWWAVSEDDVAYRILELYGCTKTPNEGVRWSNDKQFKEIARIEREHPWLAGKSIEGVADPSIWDGSKGISAAQVADDNGVYFMPGVNDRVPGWMQVHERMKFDANGYAMIYFFSTCKAIIRCMPLMMFDEHIPEDLDSDLEDHCLDDCRYFCMSRIIPPRIIETEYIPISDPLNQYKSKVSLIRR